MKKQIGTILYERNIYALDVRVFKTYILFILINTVLKKKFIGAMIIKEKFFDKVYIVLLFTEVVELIFL